jgi:hypothetical protein
VTCVHILEEGNLSVSPELQSSLGMAAAAGADDVSFVAFKEPFKLGKSYALVKQLGKGAYGAVVYVAASALRLHRRFACLQASGLFLLIVLSASTALHSVRWQPLFAK